MSTWTAAQNKALGWFYFVVAAIGLVAAFLTQPFSEWGAWGVTMGTVIALFGLVGLYQGITGRGNTRSRTVSEGRQRTIAIIGLVFLTLAVGSLILGNAGEWTAVDTLSVSIWVALGGLFVSQILTLGKGAQR